jgi:sigma54-dependent transcription regulator
MIKLNCAAISAGLPESELFDHERGIFTGAIAQKMGRLELKDKGTLFLDEVGDLPLEVQPKPMRASQGQEFERVGDTQTRQVDVRLVATTNRDLEKMVAERVRLALRASRSYCGWMYLWSGRIEVHPGLGHLGLQSASRFAHRGGQRCWSRRSWRARLAAAQSAGDAPALGDGVNAIYRRQLHLFFQA